jgi:hypothetical protein
MASLSTTVQASGTQTNTQSPQSATGASSGAARSAAVQPGTATNVLTADGGVPLGGTKLTTVSLTGSSTSTQAAVTPPKAQHTSPVFLGFAGVLFVAAIVVFVLMTRAEKNTTI